MSFLILVLSLMYIDEIHELNYVVFLEEDRVEERKKRFEEGYGCKLDLVATIDPSYIDALLHWLNPNNENFTTRIYKINLE